MVRRRLDPHPSSVSEARRLVRETLRSSQRDDLVELAELLLSEVVTNAVVHAGTAVEVVVLVGDQGLCAEVSDGSRHLPAPQSHSTLTGTGRGLHLLEQLVDSWGVQVQGEGKTVWFRLSSGDREAGPAQYDLDFEVDLDDLLPAVDRFDVSLLGVPLLLHAAWQMHSESLLREYLLIRLDDDSPLEAIESHAAAHEAMALLRQHVPAPDVGIDPTALMAAAVEPGVSSARLSFPVPHAAVPNFAHLDETLDAALALADAGRLLTPPTQPEVRLLRRWLCREVQRQAQGAGPTPWRRIAHLLPPPAQHPLPWDAEALRSSDRALIAADDTNGIVAVSRSAADLLGYPDVTALEGQRLVEIIPERYHQAHLAGFTLHLFAERRPLLGRPVTVPAKRRDGTEVMVELLVDSTLLRGGRRLFVADLRRSDPAS